MCDEIPPEAVEQFALDPQFEEMVAAEADTDAEQWDYGQDAPVDMFLDTESSH